MVIFAGYQGLSSCYIQYVMEFVFPSFLWALPAIFIPLIIHLFRFRRYRKVYFSNVRLIEALKFETERQSKLKHILVLLARMMAIAMLLLAFAQPYIPVDKDAQHLEAVRYVSIYIDNSFSMEAASTDGILLDLAREKAMGIASAYGATDVFHLITNDLEGRHHRFISREDFLNLLLEVEPSPVSIGLEDVYARHRELLAREAKQGEVYVISDFQYSIIRSNLMLQDSGLRVFLLPLQAVETPNAFIDSVWFTSPVQLAGMQSQLTVRIKNSGTQDLEKIPLRLLINGEQRAVSTLDIQAGASQETSFGIRLENQGWYEAVAEITDYPVTYDDKLYFAFQVRQRIPVMQIHNGQSGPFLPALFGRDSSILYTQYAALDLDYGRLTAQDLIILHNLDGVSSGLQNALQDYVIQGGSLVIFPGGRAELQEYSQLTAGLNLGRIGDLDTAETRVSDVDREHPLLKDVFDPGVREAEGTRTDLPLVFSHYPISLGNQTDANVVVHLQNGRPFLAASRLDKGKAYLFAVPLDPAYSSLPRHALLVPFLYQMALNSRPAGDLQYTVGQDAMLSLSDVPRGEEMIKLRPSGNGPELVPELRRRGNDLGLFFGEQVRNAGVYQVRTPDTLLALAAFNYDRRESDLRYYTIDELENIIARQGWRNTRILDASQQDTQKVIQDIQKGKRLWTWFIILSLIFLAIEAALLRFLK